MIFLRALRRRVLAGFAAERIDLAQRPRRAHLFDRHVAVAVSTLVASGERHDIRGSERGRPPARGQAPSPAGRAPGGVGLAARRRRGRLRNRPRAGSAARSRAGAQNRRPLAARAGLGAVADGRRPQSFIDRELAARLDIPDSWIAEESARQFAEIERRRGLYGGGRPPLEIAGRTAIVVDDGIATGATMRVALEAVRRRGPRRLVLAVPVAPPETLASLAGEVNETACFETPEHLAAIGFYYRDFHQMTDAEVIDLLARAPAPR
jgi:putative phosphoribosyl transferase